MDDASPENDEEEMNPTLAPTESHADSPSGDERDRPRILRSEDLLQGRKELWIEHGDDMYRLRLTSAGKLYLTK